MRNGVLEAVDAAVRLTDAVQSQDLHRRKTIGNLLGCHRGTLGGRLEKCLDCSRASGIPHSCRNRSCPRCQAGASLDWLESQRASLLDAKYFHNVFTLPHSLNPVVRQNREKCLSLLFRSAAETLDAFARDKLGAKIGYTAVLHTWGQTLCEHYHLHLIVAGGGISLDGERWVDAPGRRLFAVQALSQVFRAKYLSGLEALREADELEFHGGARRFAGGKAFGGLLAQAARKKWAVYSKRPFAGPGQVLKYLSLYTHRAGISDGRILSVRERRLKVSFLYKDYADGSRIKRMRLGLAEFLRRFCLHVLPPRFVKIRHYGILSNRNRKALVARSRVLIKRIRPVVGEGKKEPAETPEGGRADEAFRSKEPCCPWCGSPRLEETAVLGAGRILQRPVLYVAFDSG